MNIDRQLVIRNGVARIKVLLREQAAQGARTEIVMVLREVACIRIVADFEDGSVAVEAVLKGGRCETVYLPSARDGERLLGAVAKAAARRRKGQFNA